MTDMRPVKVYSLVVPPGDTLVEANPGVPASIRITMASIDPDEEVEGPARATLRIVHDILNFEDEDYEDDSGSEDDSEDDADDIEALEKRLGVTDSDQEMEDVDDEDSEEEVPLIKASSKKQAKAQLKALKKQLEEEEEEEEDSADDEEGGANSLESLVDAASDGMQSYVVCTLDRKTNYQVPLDITIRENEECFFRNTGRLLLYLTGNFVVPSNDIESDEDSVRSDDDPYGMDDYSSDEDSEQDTLDDLADPRVVEIQEDDEDEPIPQLVKSNKAKNKRTAADDESDAEPPKVAAAAAAAKNQEKHPSKKQKNNAGQAIANENKKTVKTEASKGAKVGEANGAATNGNSKKVQFAQNLEQGPTPPKTAPVAKGPRSVNGITVDDKKVGAGPAAKKGDKVGLRYIGKLKDGKVFDANKKGKPFTFKVGAGEVIKGWDIGIQGMSVGGERRIIIPANLAYGSKKLPGIPPNSDLTFDLKMITIN